MTRLVQTWGLVLLLAAFGCGKGELDVDDFEGRDAGLALDGSHSTADAGTVPGDPRNNVVIEPPDMGGMTDDVDLIESGPFPNKGWIGGPCASAADCEFEGAVCLTEGHPEGQCSLPCDRLCPDRDGENSVTFCVEKGGGGYCVSQCDFDLYPDDGCREDYSCRIVPRFGEPGTQNTACLPGEAQNPAATTACLRALDEAGVIWAPWPYVTEYDDGLACTINDPIRVSSPLGGVTYRYYNQESAGTMAMACDLALALVRLSELLREYGLSDLLHIGTFNCRKIAGSSRLSQHSYGMAIDIYGFVDDAGQTYILERDWEHNTSSPQDPKAKILYEVAQQMHERQIFNIVLTPNYNGAHDNHFHVDLTAGSDFIGSSLPPEYYLGSDPARWQEACD